MENKAEDLEFKFGRVAFFGRGLDEYMNMFNLDMVELMNSPSHPRILDCPAGPAAFAMQCAAVGVNVVACDPMYGEDDIGQLRNLIDVDSRNVSAKQEANPELFHPQLTPMEVRRQAMEQFLADYSRGRELGRYVAGQLPYLPFEDHCFDLVLSANLLFIYSDIASGGMMENSPFTYDFHKRALFELMRVTRHEVRVYPLRGPRAPGNENIEEHAYLAPLTKELVEAGYHVEVQPVPQRDIVGAEKMLVIVMP